MLTTLIESQTGFVQNYVSTHAASHVTFYLLVLHQSKRRSVRSRFCKSDFATGSMRSFLEMKASWEYGDGSPGAFAEFGWSCGLWEDGPRAKRWEFENVVRVDPHRSLRFHLI